MTSIYSDIGDEVGRHGLVLRGGFAVAAEDAVPDLSPGVPAASVLMIGNTGGAMWRAFEARGMSGGNPLDRWTREVIAPVADRFGARAVYPFETPPLPFQRWAARAWPLFPSPLGLLIDRQIGLWHALRAALLFDTSVAVPVQADTTARSPCETCADKPCLAACPIEAFTQRGFDFVACRGYLATAQGTDCLTGGCKARAACPVGTEHRYPAAQLAFHLRAFGGVR